MFNLDCNNNNFEDRPQTTNTFSLQSMFSISYNGWMNDNQLKTIGTVSIQELKNISSYVPWEELVKKDIPFSAIGTPDGYLFTQGSACSSLATTSTLGWMYNADFYVWRLDGIGVDRDRYLGSVTPENTLAVLLVSKQLTPYHHLELNDPPLISLPIIHQKNIKSLLRGTQLL